MSRFCFNDDSDEYANAGLLWWSNLERAVRGKRGQKVLAELEETLVALPEKRLVSGTLVGADGCACTVGALVLRRGEQAGVPRHEVARAMLAGSYCECGHSARNHHRLEGACSGRSIYGGVKLCGCSGLRIDFERQDESDTTAAGVAAGLTPALAWRLAYLNDEELASASPEQRYERVLAWIRKNRSAA